MGRTAFACAVEVLQGDIEEPPHGKGGYVSAAEGYSREGRYVCGGRVHS